MHILLTIPSLNAGGAERVLAALANYWEGRGHQISLITLTAVEEKSFYPLAKSIKVIPLAQTTPKSKFTFSRLTNIWKRILGVRKIIQRIKPDVVISFLDITNITTLFAILGLRIPVIISERIDPAYRPLPRLYKWLRLKIYPHAKALVVQTSSSASYFPTNFQYFIKIIPNSVKPAPILKQTSDGVASIVSIGRLDAQKDHQTLIHSFAKVLTQHPSLKLTIYGEGPERQNLETLIHSLNLTQKVHLPGVTPHIYEALAKADLFVFPSRYEGFPNALCEAMSVGLPVIASNCSGNIDIVRDGIDGRLFPVGDDQALASILEELLKDSKQRQCLSANALTVTDRFREASIYQQWDALLQDVIPTTLR